MQGVHVKVADLIAILERFQEQHGAEAQISLPRINRDVLVGGSGQDVVLREFGIATVLGSEGASVEY
jgi:hypothetical protein